MISFHCGRGWGEQSLTVWDVLLQESRIYAMATSGMQLSSDVSSRSDAACCGEYGGPERLKTSLVGLAPIPWGTAGSEGYLEPERGCTVQFIT